MSKVEDTIYQRHYVSGKESQEFRSSRTLLDNNPAMGMTINNEADGSIETQSEEEGMPRHQIIETTD